MTKNILRYIYDDSDQMFTKKMQIYMKITMTEQIVQCHNINQRAIWKYTSTELGNQKFLIHLHYNKDNFQSQLDFCCPS